MACNCNESGLMGIEQANAIIKQSINVLTDTQSCSLSSSLGRVLASDIVSSVNVPSYDNSAMDGYAFRHEDIKHTRFFTQIGKSFAGNPYKGEVGEGECIRIMTGALIPKGADTVVMQENTKVNGQQVELIGKVKKGEAVRLSGSDIAKSDLILKKGKRLTAIDIGLLASIGIEFVTVYRKLKVAVFSTGDELLTVNEKKQTHRIFDSNRPMLLAMLNDLGVEAIDFGIIGDDKTLIKQAFEAADKKADCVITSGGVSVGEADYTREVLGEIGDINFWKLAIKPGKPLAFGQLKNSLFFGLPGNPVSAAITFEQIAKPCLLLMAGCAFINKLSLVAKADRPFKKKVGRTDFQRAYYTEDEQGNLFVKPSGSQSSAVLSCFSKSNCYAILEDSRGDVEPGEKVTIQVFS